MVLNRSPRASLRAAQASRRGGIVAGIALVLVPTVFSIYPEWTHWPVLARTVVLVAWFLAAAFVVAATTRQGEQVDDLVGEPLERRTAARGEAARSLLEAALQPAAAGFPSHYEIRLFLPDPTGLLVAEYESQGSAPAEGWLPRTGAVGYAWSSNGLTVVQGDAVSDSKYGLTPEQQIRYEDLQIVVACPVQNARGRPIGVLAVSSESDDAYFDDPRARLEVVALSEVVARVLIDVARLDKD